MPPQQRHGVAGILVSLTQSDVHKGFAVGSGYGINKLLVFLKSVTQTFSCCITVQQFQEKFHRFNYRRKLIGLAICSLDLLVAVTMHQLSISVWQDLSRVKRQEVPQVERTSLPACCESRKAP